jgi:hypothetical protein
MVDHEKCGISGTGLPHHHPEVKLDISERESSVDKYGHRNCDDAGQNAPEVNHGVLLLELSAR